MNKILQKTLKKIIKIKLILIIVFFKENYL